MSPRTHEFHCVWQSEDLCVQFSSVIWMPECVLRLSNLTILRAISLAPKDPAFNDGIHVHTERNVRALLLLMEL